jgi:hypothetical protein
MPVPTSINDLSTTAGSNSPVGGTDAPSTLDDYQRAHASFLAQIRDGSVVWGGTAGGTADVITLTPSVAWTSYVTGRSLAFISSGANTGAVTLNVSSLGARAVTKNGATALAAGDIPSGATVSVVYDGTQFQLLRNGSLGAGSVTTSGLTMSTARMLGRTTASTGAIEEITVGSGLSLSGGSLSATAVSFSPITASLGANVSLNNTANYFDGPSIAQGTSGTWFVSGTVTVRDATAGANSIAAKLWDGTTTIASGGVEVDASTRVATISLSGYIASPAGDLRISCRDSTTTSGTMEFNSSGNSKDCTISAIRIA